MPRSKRRPLMKGNVCKSRLALARGKLAVAIHSVYGAIKKTQHTENPVHRWNNV
ncbi:MAG: hypothetical protein ACI8Z9_001861 [Paraglaciecola sp.]